MSETMERILAGDLKMDIVMRLAELAAVIPDGCTNPADAATVRTAADEIERLRAALDNSQSLLTAMLIERRPQNEIESQIIENRGVLNHEQSAAEGK
jgi:hypothetical protein